MPTIHIHTPDADTCGAIVADLLERSYGSTFSITIDLDGASGDPSSPTAARVATSRATLVEDPSWRHPVVDAVMSASTKREADRAKKQWTRDNWDDLISVRCPTCKAEANESCKSPSGKPYGIGFVHNVRLEARQWRAARLDQARALPDA